MEEPEATGRRPSLGATALARLQLRVLRDAGPEEVVVERRWPDMAGARQWCERFLQRADGDTEVLEIQVFEERWQHAKSWEAGRHRPEPQALQLGIADAHGGIRWAEPRSMTPHHGARLPL